MSQLRELPISPSTYFGLMAEFQKAHVPIEEAAGRYFAHDAVTAKDKARKGKYPFPVFKVGTQWFVDIGHLAEYLDGLKKKAKEEFSLTRKSSVNS